MWSAGRESRPTLRNVGCAQTKRRSRAALHKKRFPQRAFPSAPSVPLRSEAGGLARVIRDRPTVVPMKIDLDKQRALLLFYLLKESDKIVREMEYDSWPRRREMSTGQQSGRPRRHMSSSSSARDFIPPSTVGRGKAISLATTPVDDVWRGEFACVRFGDSRDFYNEWPSPTVIISDGGYGVLGFEGDTSDHIELPAWYEPHVKCWAAQSTANTTLWFWNSEIGWASVHPVLEKYGWRYVNCNIWNKGKAHIAGNVNTTKIRRFPVVTEVCVQYVLEARIGGMSLREWLLLEWKRSGLPLKEANKACGVADAAVRKYLDQGHLWYFPPQEMFLRLQEYANKNGHAEGRPYFSIDGKQPLSGKHWASFRAKFRCPHAVTNVWDRNPLSGKERFRIDGLNGKAVHLNQKPLDLMMMIIEASSDADDVVWEPFGGLFTACVAAGRLKRWAFGAEIDPTYFQFGVSRLKREASQHPLF